MPLSDWLPSRFFRPSNQPQTNVPSQRYMTAAEEFNTDTRRMTASAARVQVGAASLAVLRLLSGKPFAFIPAAVTVMLGIVVAAGHMGSHRSFKLSQKAYLETLNHEELSDAHLGPLATASHFIPSESIQKHLPDVPAHLVKQVDAILATPHHRFNFPHGADIVDLADQKFQTHGLLPTLRGLLWDGLDKGSSPLGELGQQAGESLASFAAQQTGPKA